MGFLLGALYVCGTILICFLVAGLIFCFMFWIIKIIFVTVKRIFMFFCKQYNQKRNPEPSVHWFTLPDGRKRYLP